MKIPQQLPQFKGRPTVLAVCGDFEARFYLAKDGDLAETEAIEMSMRDDAKEKQVFIDAHVGKQSLGAVSHHDRYLEDLKRKFRKRFVEELGTAVSRSKASDIYFLCPTHASTLLTDSLPESLRNKIKRKIEGSFTKEHPVRILELIQADIDKSAGTEHIHHTKAEKKILHQPLLRRSGLRQS